MGAKLFRIILAVFITAFSVVNCVPSLAASLVASPSEQCNYLLSGEIENGDLAKIKSINPRTFHALCLNSLGGNYIAALDIAEYLIQNSIETVLDRNSDCFSACAIIFMAGSVIEEVPLPKKKMHISARLGFHAPYILPKKDTYTSSDVQLAYSVGLNATARMMALGAINGERVGLLSNDLILALLKKGPGELLMIDRVAKAKALSIHLFGHPRVQWNLRSICNACYNFNKSYQFSWATSESCSEQQAQNVKQKQLTKQTKQLWFSDFGAEAASYCVAKLTQQQDSKFELTMAKGYFGADDAAGITFLPVADDDGLPPDFPIGR